MSVSKPLPPHFNDLIKETPYTLMDRFAGEIRPNILSHQVSALDVTECEVAFSTFGVAGADSGLPITGIHSL